MNPSRVVSWLALLTVVAVTPSGAFFQDPEPATPDRAELEAQFARTMSGAKLVGFFTESWKSEGEAPKSSDLHEESYTIAKVTHLDGDRWRFDSVIEYGGKSFTFPLVLEVKWAGDTPVITLTDMKIPMLGTFTARVLVYRGQYVGIWAGGDHGGQMFGRVVTAAEQEREADAEDDDERTVNWPSFRGPGASGLARGFETVASWDVESGDNVLWKAPVPGLAHSSPVIWGDRLFVTSAVKEGDPALLKVGLYGSTAPVDDDSAHEFNLVCIDKQSGEVLWTRTAWEGVPAFKRHPKGSFAASTPATDGEHVVAFFGSEGLHCYDVDGEVLWQNDLGMLDAGWFMIRDHQWGFGSSPVIHEDKVIVQCDVQEGSFLAAFDLESGEELWAVERNDVPTWGSPTVDVRDGRAQIICNGWKHIGGYDLETGAELWMLRGGGDIPVPTPVVAHDLIFITNAHGRQAPIYAIDALATGVIDTDSKHMAWSLGRRGNYMQTPLVEGDLLYCCSDGGILACYDARSGRELYRERLASGGMGFTASMVAADGKLYATRESGEIFVVRAGPEFELIAQNEMGEECMATPAVSEGVLYWRTKGHVVAIGGP